MLLLWHHVSFSGTVTDAEQKNTFRGAEIDLWTQLGQGRVLCESSGLPTKYWALLQTLYLWREKHSVFGTTYFISWYKAVSGMELDLSFSSQFLLANSFTVLLCCLGSISNMELGALSGSLSHYFSQNKSVPGKVTESCVLSYHPAEALEFLKPQSDWRPSKLSGRSTAWGLKNEFCIYENTFCPAEWCFQLLEANIIHLNSSGKSPAAADLETNG